MQLFPSSPHLPKTELPCHSFALITKLWFIPKWPKSVLKPCLCWVIWYRCAVVSHQNWHWPLSESLIASGVAGMMLLSTKKISFIIIVMTSECSFPRLAHRTDWWMMSGQGGSLSNVQPVPSLFVSWLELHLWWWRPPTSDLSCFLSASLWWPHGISSPCVCALLDVLCPNCSPQNYKTWQTPEAGHYQCYLLILPQLMESMVHSEWAHQVVKSNLQLIFQLSSLLWNLTVESVWSFLWAHLLVYLRARCQQLHTCIILPTQWLKKFVVFSQNPSFPQWTLHCMLLGCLGIGKGFGRPLKLGF